MATPLRAIGRGMVAGYAGMAAMAVVVSGVQKLLGEDGGGKPKAWKDAEPPAEFAHRVIVGVARRHVSVERAPMLNYTMHAIYAPTLGAWYGIFQESLHPKPWQHGLAFAASVWGLRNALLPGLNLGEPLWKHPPQKLAVDASFHVVFGLAVAYAYRGTEAVL